MTPHPFNVEEIRKSFPNLKAKVQGKPLVYLDNAATTFKPQSVINAVMNHYQSGTSNVHRGVHTLSQEATTAFEGARDKVRGLVHASNSREIIFTKGTTEALNLVATSYGQAFLKKGDEVIISEMEHHSNIVPWQLLCEANGCVLKVVPFNDDGELMFEKFMELLGPKTKFVSLVYISNSLGTINPVKDIIDAAHRRGAVVLIDGAQTVAHIPVDVQNLDCDFFVFSGHKILGPTGIGVLYGKEVILNQMPPYQGGGDMIASVTFEKTLYNVLPYKFEAGTPNVAGAIGLGAAVDYIQSIGLSNIERYEQELLDYGTKALSNIPDLRLIGTAKRKAAILSFVLPNIHPHDVGTLVDEEGVAIRTGHHCTQPVMKHFNVSATSRASFAFYNTQAEIDQLVQAIYKVKDIFK
jgi:cysteine desulfurase/selenocysteine lyase